MDIKVQNAFRIDTGEYLVCKVFENHGEQIPVGTILDVPNTVSQARADELVEAKVVNFTGKKLEKAEKKPDMELSEDDFKNEKIIKDLKKSK